MAETMACASAAVLMYGVITPSAPASSTRLNRGASLAAMRTMAGRRRRAHGLQLVQQRVLATGAVLVVQQEPVEAQVAGDLGRNW